MEMAAQLEIVAVAERAKPAWACLVPEKRQELTTEGGLDVSSNKTLIAETITRLHGAGVRVSLFVDADINNIQLAEELNADAVEIHTGTYARNWSQNIFAPSLKKIYQAAEEAKKRGLLVNAGHGITYENISDLISGFDFNELNIGFSIVARALTVGLRAAVKEMKQKMVNKICAAS